MKLLPLLIAFLLTFKGYPQSLPTDVSRELPTLKIVELVAKGSVLTNEFSMKADWLRLENFGNDTINLSDYRIYITDDADRLKKFRLKKKTIAPDSSIIIWCDDLAMTRKQIHTNFKLSSLGETISLTIKRGSRTEIIDQAYYAELGEEVQITLLRSESNSLVFSNEH